MIRRINMARSRLQFIAPALVLLFISSTLLSVEMVKTEETEQLVEIVHFEVSADTYKDLGGHISEYSSVEQREVEAHSRIGIWDATGLEVSRPLPAEYLEPRQDLSLILIDNSRHFSDVRQDLDKIRGLEVKEYISPS